MCFPSAGQGRAREEQRVGPWVRLFKYSPRAAGIPSSTPAASLLNYAKQFTLEAKPGESSLKIKEEGFGIRLHCIVSQLDDISVA